MNTLNNQAGAIEARGTFAAGGYPNAVPHALEDGPWAVVGKFRALVTKSLALLCGPDRFHALADFLRSLRDRSDWRGSPASRGKMAAKYIVRALCMPRQHGRYLALMYGQPHLCAYQRRDPRVLERHFHRYIHLRWDRRLRLRSIRQHYQFAIARLPGALLQRIYTDGNATLGRLILKDGTQLELCLRPPIFMGCEGELCIQLSDLDNHPVYRLILSVIDDRPTIAIGCIQGPDGPNGKNRVRDLTRNMHGMRPKQLMLSLAYAFARHLGIERILAVSNAAHPLRRARDEFQADYDAFWVEQKGREEEDGWFLLPETLSRKSEAEVSSHHRSAFRRRETLRIEAERLIVDALGTSPSKPNTALAKEELESVEPFQHAGLGTSWIR